MDLKFKDNSKLKLAPFTQLEYIESSGTQYINTGIKLDGTEQIEFKFSNRTLVTNPYNAEAFFGFRETSKGDISLMNSYNNNNIIDYYYSNNTDSTYYINSTTNGILICNKGTVLLDEISIITRNNITLSSITQNCFLLAKNNNGVASNFTSIRLCGFSVIKNNIKVLDFLPAKDPNGVVCLYDTVSKTFFYNQGTGDFVAGPVVKLGLPTTILQKTTTIYHKNTPNVNGLQLLNNILNAQETAEDVVLNRIRVDIGNVSGSLSELMQYADMAGFNDNYEPQTKPRLVGTWTVNDWYTSAQIPQAQAAFDGLTIVGDPNYLINFNDLAVQVLDPNEDNYNPAVAIILQGQNRGITTTVAPLGYGRWFMTKTQAAAVTDIATKSSAIWISWFASATTINDRNNIVDGESHNFTSFNELKYFTNVNFRSDGNTRNNLFYGCSLLEEVTIPSHINSIPVYGFAGCGSLIKVNLDNIIRAGMSCFAGCSNLPLTDTDVSKLTYIGANAFQSCAKATFTTINASVTNIDETLVHLNTFTYTISIPYLHFLSETPITSLIGSYARTHTYNSFYGTTYKIYVGDGSSAAHDDSVLAAYQAASNWSGMVSYLDTWYNYLHPQS